MATAKVKIDQPTQPLNDEIKEIQIPRVPFTATFGALPDPTANVGTFAVTNDTKILWFAAFGAWWPVIVLQ